MTEPTEVKTNVVEGKPFISLKNILEDEDFSHVTLAELVTAIEAHGIYTYDPFDRLVLCKVDSEQVQEVMTLLRKVKFHDPNYNEEHGIREYDPHPLDDIINENFGKYPSEPQTYPSRSNYYGWLKTDLPNLFSTEPDQMESSPTNQSEANTANQEPVKVAKPLIKNESTHDAKKLDAIALMFPINPNNLMEWRVLAKNADRNGLHAARTAVGKGKAQSMFDPVLVGQWLVSKGKMDQARVDRILMSNLPPRNAHLKDLYT